MWCYVLWRNYKVLTSNAHLPWTESKCFDYRKKKEHLFMHRINRPRDENDHFNNMKYVAWKSIIQPQLFGQFWHVWVVDRMLVTYRWRRAVFDQCSTQVFLQLIIGKQLGTPLVCRWDRCTEFQVRKWPKTANNRATLHCLNLKNKHT